MINELAKRARISPPVFLISGALIIAFVLFGAIWTPTAANVFNSVQEAIVDNFSWFYMLSVAVFLLLAAALAVSTMGRLKLGPDDSDPDYTNLSWFAMLFSAGMGIGIMFFGVAEPIQHFTSPPVGDGGTIESARNAMAITFFHWGFHAWGIYIVVGLALAYFSFRQGLPLTLRSALYPILGERINGPIGHAVDIFAVLGTMFGVATSLGLGALQVNAGLAHLFDIPVTVNAQIILIAVITLMATVSVVTGLDYGIRRLSEANLLLAIALMVFVLAAGPTIFLMKAFVQNTGAYLSQIVDLTFRLYAYEPNDWIGGWTLFYWAWWIAWSPFVGMFIARISRGRTIREFIVGVLFVPAGFTFLWLTVFGDTAIHHELYVAAGAISGVVDNNLPIALFALLETMPGSAITSFIAIVLVVTFFVTSSDSASLVITMIASGGMDEPPVWQRIFWAVSEGVVAAVLLLAGGLAALQTASIASAFPFAIVMLFVCFGLWRGLRIENTRRMHRQVLGPPQLPIAESIARWEHRLQSILKKNGSEEVRRFLRTTVHNALEEVAGKIEEGGYETHLETGEDYVRLTVLHGGERDFLYEVRKREYRQPTFAFPEMTFRQDEGRHYCRAEIYLLEGHQHYDIMGYTKDQVINDFLIQFETHMHLLHMPPNVTAA